MSAYVRGSGSYEAYLQQKSFVDDIRWDISKANLDFVASGKALAQQGVKIETAVRAVDKSIRTGFEETSQILDRGFARVTEGLEQVDETLTLGFVRLHRDLSSIDVSIAELSATFDWGLARLEAAVGGVNDSIQELVRLARTPEQTWAYEQFEIARDALNKGLYPEALEHVERAINGHLAHTGYKLEYRFHYLLGIVRRGDYRNWSPDIYDLAKAELAYVNAARYAEADHKDDAARALCAAGWVAYCQGKMDTAIVYTKKSISMFRLPEASYQLSKFFFHQKEPATALEYFSSAIEADPLYALRCFDDDDFRPYEPELVTAIMRRREVLASIYTAAIFGCRKIIAMLSLGYQKLCERAESIGWDKVGAITPDIGTIEIWQPQPLPKNTPFLDTALAVRAVPPKVEGLAEAIAAYFKQVDSSCKDMVEGGTQQAFERTRSELAGKISQPGMWVVMSWFAYALVMFGGLSSCTPLINSGHTGVGFLVFGIVVGYPFVVPWLVRAAERNAVRNAQTRALRDAERTASAKGAELSALKAEIDSFARVMRERLLGLRAASAHCR
jgi:tetratricopeptide (TPR) repeat protein